MPKMKKIDLERLLFQIRSKASAEWIQELKAEYSHFEKIIHFGCADGLETLALLIELNSNEIYGVDKDISEAKLKVNQLKTDIEESIRAKNYCSQEDYMWWEEQVPEILKKQIIPFFIMEPDITSSGLPYKVPSDLFNLACCSCFLYILLNNQGEDATLCAINEMKRVTTKGGLIIVNEPSKCVEEKLKPLFVMTGMEEVRRNIVKNIPGETTLTYRKVQ
jgi:SAM-dependent methyltransferase